jgi:methylsterol monooxygenase
MLPHPKNTYWHEFDQTAAHTVQLNYFERLWAAWYAYIGNDVLATGIMSFVMHEVFYFGRALPWIIIDQIPYFNKYKIQNVRIPQNLTRGDTFRNNTLTC